MPLGSPELDLGELIATQIQKVLEERLAGVITEINTAKKDLTLPAPVQILPHMMTEASTEAGLPAFGIAELPTVFEDDLVSSVAACYEMYVHVIHQDADHESLAKALRRYVRAIAICIQRDRAAGISSVLSRSANGIWAVMFQSIQPGPLLGERNPTAPDDPPISWLSWSGVVVSLKREEI